MGVIAWLVLGLLAGAVTKAFLGGWLSARFLDRPVHRGFFDAATRGSAIAGALVLPIDYRLLFGNSRD